MGIFNEHPDSKSSGSYLGVRGSAGIGFKLDKDGNYDMDSKQLKNICDGGGDVVSKKWITDHVSTNLQDLTPYLKKDGSVQLTKPWNANNQIFKFMFQRQIIKIVVQESRMLIIILTTKLMGTETFTII